MSITIKNFCAIDLHVNEIYNITVYQEYKIDCTDLTEREKERERDKEREKYS